MNIKQLIEKSRRKRIISEGAYILVSDCKEWLCGVESHIKHIDDNNKFFIDIDEKGVMRAFFKNNKVGVWGGVPGNGYYIAKLRKSKDGELYNKIL